MENNGTFGPSVSSPSPTNRLQELILSLDQAAFMARQLPATSDPAHLHQINSVLHHAHHSLSSFLSAPPLPPPPPPPPAAENSVSSATHNGSASAAEPMQVGENEGEAEEESSIDRVEERMRNCFIKNKRPKRPLSPSAAAEDEEERGSGGLGVTGFDPHTTRLRALDLVYQFHG